VAGANYIVMDEKALEWILSNGGVPTVGSRRYDRRDVHEDRVKYQPTKKQPKIALSKVVNWDKTVSLRGEVCPDKIRGKYPLATKILYCNFRGKVCRVVYL